MCQVLLIGPYPPPHGGVETHVVSIRTFLRSVGVPVAVLNITRHRKPEGDGIYYPRHAAELVWRLVTLKYDLIHLHFGGHLSRRLLLLSLVCTLLPRVRTALTFHSGGYPSSPAGRAARRGSFAGAILRRFDHVIAVNEELREMFLRFGVAPDRVSVIAPHAVSGITGSEGTLREDMKTFFEAHDPVLLTVGGMEPEYAIPLQADMLGILRQTLPNAGLVVIGGGRQETEIRAFVASKPWASHVLLCGDVAHGSTLQAIGRADLLLRPTLFDGDSIAVREALHLGTPVLATDNGMRPAGVHLVKDPDPASLSARVVECLHLGRHTTAPDTGQDNLDALLVTYTTLAPALKQTVRPRAAVVDP